MSLFNSLVQQVKAAFGLEGAEVKAVDRVALQQQLATAIEKAVADDELTDDEIAKLEELRTSLGLTPEELRNIQYTALRSLVQKILADNHVSEDETSISSSRTSTVRWVLGLRSWRTSVRTWCTSKCCTGTWSRTANRA